MGLRRNKCLRQTGLQLPGIQSEVEYCNASVSQTVGQFRFEQPAIRRDIDPETFYCCVVNNLVDEVGPQQWLTAHAGENTAPVVIEPINGSARNVLGHSLHSVIEGPAVSAIKIALVLDKQVRRNRMEVTRQDARPDVRVQLPSHGAVNRSRSPFAVSFRRILRSGVIEFLRILREPAREERDPSAPQRAAFVRWNPEAD